MSTHTLILPFCFSLCDTFPDPTLSTLLACSLSHAFPVSYDSLHLAAVSTPPTTTSTRPAGLAPIAGLPLAAHEVLHRELLHIQSSLHLILLILRGPWDTVAPSIMDTITCPRLRATLRALETSLEQIGRSTCTTLVYTEELCSALALPHPTGRLVSSPTSFSSSRPSLRLLPSPPSPPMTTTTTTTTDPSPPQVTYFSASFDSYCDLDADATFSLTFSVTTPSDTIPILAGFLTLAQSP